MRTVLWVTNDNERWCNHHHYEFLIEDITGFNLQKDLCAESVKYMAKRLKDTPYNRVFRNKYSIYQDEYKTLVEKFNSQADNNGRIVVE
jgi:hypothetical protein